MREVARASSQVTSLRVAILAALNIADELFRERENRSTGSVDIEARARSLADALEAPLITSNFSRLVIDPNRGEDDPTVLMKLYDGTIIPANRHADAAEIERRMAEIDMANSQSIIEFGSSAQSELQVISQ